MTVTIEEASSSSASLLEQTSFAVRLPASIFRGFDEPVVNPAMAAAVLHDTGVVGSILVSKKSVMIWFGWGKLDAATTGHVGAQSAAATTTESSYARPPLMGPLVVAMPRTTYQGAFSTDQEASSTKLVGSPHEDEELLCRQMASRLAAKLGVSVFVSCSLDGSSSSAMGTPTGPSVTQGVDAAMIQHRAAAMAEKEIYKLLQDRQW